MAKAKNPKIEESATTFSYDASMRELQRIVAELENDSIGIDELAEKTRRAADLIRLCREKLRTTEAAVQEVLTGDVPF